VLATVPEGGEVSKDVKDTTWLDVAVVACFALSIIMFAFTESITMGFCMLLFAILNGRDK
jgi:hypothetical protein